MYCKNDWTTEKYFSVNLKRNRIKTFHGSVTTLVKIKVPLCIFSFRMTALLLRQYKLLLQIIRL